MQKKKFFYGYIITLLSALCYFGSNGILSVSAGNVINELLNTMGWSGTQVGLAFSMRSLMGLTLPLVGYSVTRFGPRKVIGLTTILTSLCLVFTAYVQTPLQFIIAYGLGVSFTMLFNDQLAIFAAVNNWWSAKRGQQSGIVNAAGGLGGVVFPLIVAVILRDFGWKVSMWAMAIMLVVITGIPQLIFYRDHPEDIGQQIDNGYVAPPPPKESAISKQRYNSPVNWDAKDAIRTPQIWMIIIGWACMVFTYIAVMYYSISKFVMEDGMDSVAATQIVSAINLCIMLGALFLGRFVDKAGPKLTLIIVSIGSAAGCFMVNLAGSSFAFVVLLVLIFGLTQGMLVPAIMSMIPSYYGTKNYATIQGSVMWVLSLSSGFGSTLIGYTLDKTRSFSSAFIVAALVSLIATVIFVVIKPPKLTPKYEAMLKEQKIESEMA